jgi:hypothetical protein
VRGVRKLKKSNKKRGYVPENNKDSDTVACAKEISGDNKLDSLTASLNESYRTVCLQAAELEKGARAYYGNQLIAATKCAFTQKKKDSEPFTPHPISMLHNIALY